MRLLWVCIIVVALKAICCLAHNRGQDPTRAMYLQETFNFAPVESYSPVKVVPRLAKREWYWDANLAKDMLQVQYSSDYNASIAESTKEPRSVHFEALGESFTFELVPVNIAHPNAKVTVTDANGVKSSFPLTANTFEGRVLRNNEYVGECNVQMHNDDVFDGHFDVNGEMYTIKLVSVYKRVKRDIDVNVRSDHAERFSMIAYKTASVSHSDVAPNTFSNASVQGSWCGTDYSAANYSASQKPGLSLSKRDVISGCPQTPKVVYMTVVADCTYTSYYGGPLAALSQIVSDWNAASSVYGSTFKVSLGIISVEIQQTCASASESNLKWNSACRDSYPISQRLSDFSAWRGTIADDQAGLYHLMTSCSTGVSVGIAWVNQLCNAKATYQKESKAYVTGAAISSIGLEEWKVVAHEVGHNFGAIHDCTDSLCAANGQNMGLCRPCGSGCDCKGQYIMNPSESSETNEFSGYSISDICSALSGQSTSCLMEPGSLRTLSMGQCGNGIKEEDEECDCGLDCASDPCCNGATCKLYSNATCDDRNDVCCSSCQILPKNTLCRASISQCDYAEYCDGKSPSCPADAYVDNGAFCGPGLQCTSGYCTSRDQQCLSHGGDYNVTGSCPDMRTSCGMICALPAKDQCLVLSRNFMDGTVCGYHSLCYRGKCESPTTFAKLITWFIGHPIPAAIIAILFLCILIGSVYGGLHYVLYGRPNAPLAPPPLPTPPTLSTVESLSQVEFANSQTHLLNSRSSSYGALNSLAGEGYDASSSRTARGSQRTGPTGLPSSSNLQYPSEARAATSQRGYGLDFSPRMQPSGSVDYLSGYITPSGNDIPRSTSANYLPSNLSTSGTSEPLMTQKAIDSLFGKK